MVNHSHKISCLVPPERIFERKHPYQLLGVGLIGLGTVSLWPLQTILIRNIENTWGHVTRGNFFLQLATQRRFKLPFTREIASCNTSSLQNNQTAGHTTTLHMSTIEPEISFSPKFALQVARKNCLMWQRLWHYNNCILCKFFFNLWWTIVIALQFCSLYYFLIRGSQ